jgi:hypothetical protein
VAFDDVFVDFLAEQSVNVIEDLGFGDPATPVAHQIFQNPPLAAG